jgi:hypothetical protein
VDHPLARVVRWRYVIVAIVAFASGVVAGGRGDWDKFVDAARSMFASSGLHVYEQHHDVQTGPLSLSLAWLFAHTPRDGFVLAAIVSAALGLICVRLLELSADSSPRNVDADLMVLVAGCAVAFTWSKLGGYGHLDDAITLTSAVIALVTVRAGRSVVAGLATGIGIAAKPWGIIFLPITLAARRRDVRGFLVTCAVAAAAWLPFIVAAPDSLKSLRPAVNVAPDSVLALFGVTTASMPDWLRVAQLLACLAVAALLAWQRRPDLIVAAAVATRLAIDPATWSYYTPGLVVGVLVFDLQARRRLPWAALAVAVMLAPTWLVPSDDARAVLRLAITVGVVAWALLHSFGYLGATRSESAGTVNERGTQIVT